VNKDKREKIEREALEKAKKEEREKRKQGKGAWHMRDGRLLPLYPRYLYSYAF
jgi:ribosomal RNA-processing protein 36